MTVDEALQDVRSRLTVGAPTVPHPNLPPRARRALQVAETVGAPALPALDAAVASVDDARDRRRGAAVATSQARAVTVALAVLPLVAVPGLGLVLDRPLVTFYGTPPGRVVGVFGVLLLGTGVALARLTTNRMLRPSPAATSDEIYDLAATAMSAGLPAGAALRAVGDALPERAPELRALAMELELGVAPGECGRAHPELSALDAVLRTASTWGAPAAPALRRTARDLRADERARVQAATERLPALLTFPTVLFLLPASLVLVGAPLLATGLEVVAGT